MEHANHIRQHDHTAEQKAAAISSAIPPSPTRARRIASTPSLPRPSSSNQQSHSKWFGHHDVAPPPATEYGTFDGSVNAKAKSRDNSGERTRLRRSPSIGSIESQHQALQPAQNPGNSQDVMNQVSGSLIPFSNFFGRVFSLFRRKSGYTRLEDVRLFFLLSRSALMTRRHRISKILSVLVPVNACGVVPFTNASATRSTAQIASHMEKTCLSRFFDASASGSAFWKNEELFPVPAWEV